MISVCMATYNGAVYIEEQINSILSQLGLDDELVISDDGSTDDTLLILNRMADSRIKIFFNLGCSDYTSNFESALVNARGDFIFLSDQDDIWLPNKVPVLMAALQVNDFVVSDAQVVSSDLAIVHESHFKLRGVSIGFIRNLIRCRYLGCCYAFNRRVLNKALPFPRDHTMVRHDTWLILVAYLFFKVGRIDVPLIKYRRHTSNVSSGGDFSTNSFFFKVKYRVYILYHLAKVFVRSVFS